MKRKLNILKGDIALWVIFFLLSCISLVAVYITFETPSKDSMDLLVNRNFLRHLAFVVISYAALIFISNLNHRIFSKISVWLLLLSIGLLIYIRITGNLRWVKIGDSFQFQPSELAKLALVLFLVRSIVHLRDKLEEKSTLYLLMVPVAIVCALVFKGSNSSTILILVTSYLVLFFGNVCPRLWWKGFILIVLLLLGMLSIFYFYGDKIDIGRSGTGSSRLQTWLNPDPDKLTQENMARMAIARGGFFGRGIGTTVHGRLMEESHNDFIFSVIIEERGLLAGLLIFFLYAWFYFRCIRIASRCKGLFGSLLVASLGTSIFLQAIANMAVNVGLFPVTGQTLPFISYGGTAYLSTACAFGIIQAVAHDNKRQAKLMKAADSCNAEPTADTPTTAPHANDKQQNSYRRPNDTPTPHTPIAQPSNRIIL